MTEATAPGHDAIGGDRSVMPFFLAVSDAEIDELRRRLHATRWPDPATVEDGTVAFVDCRFGQAVLMGRHRCRLSVPRSSFPGFRFRRM
jgi:hypothetical protein